jgi:hypothetical protein
MWQKKELTNNLSQQKNNSNKREGINIIWMKRVSPPLLSLHSKQITKSIKRHIPSPTLKLYPMASTE